MMTELEILASLERAMDKWIAENCEDMDVGWWPESCGRYMATAAIQPLLFSRDSWVESDD